MPVHPAFETVSFHVPVAKQDEQTAPKKDLSAGNPRVLLTARRDSYWENPSDMTIVAERECFVTGNGETLSGYLGYLENGSTSKPTNSPE